MTKIAEHEIHAIVFLRACSSADARSVTRHEIAALNRCHWQLLVRPWQTALCRKTLTTDIADSDSVNPGSLGEELVRDEEK